jgi:ribosomal protein S18 acetylase RimI-like enzyme
MTNQANNIQRKTSKISPVKPDELEKINYEQKCIFKENAIVFEAFESTLFIDSLGFLKIETNESNELIGFGIIYPISTDLFKIADYALELHETYPNKVAHLILFAICEEYRKMGYGSLLLDHLKTKIKRLGYKYLVLELEKNNEVAMQFYLKNGFMLMDEHDDYYANGESALILSLEI